MVTIQLTKFINLSYNDDNISYGYRIYNKEKSEYNNSFVTLEELSNYASKDIIMTFLPYLYF